MIEIFLRLQIEPKNDKYYGKLLSVRNEIPYHF